MNLTEFLARLSRGPLSNLALSNEGNGTIQAPKIPGIVDYTNQALLRLYTRFDLSEKEVIVEQRELKTLYKLTSAAAVSVIGPGDAAYIIDSDASPFTNDVVKVLAVFRVDGKPIALNDESVEDALFTPTYDVLQVPNPIAGSPLFVMYQAKHALLSSVVLSADIDLPEVLEEAALAYVAHKVYFNMNGQEHAAKSADHLTMYESICAEVSNRDLVGSSVSTYGYKFNRKGFV